MTRELEYEFYTSITGMETVLTGFFSSNGLASNHAITKDMVARANSIIDFLDIAQLKNKNLDTIKLYNVMRKIVLAGGNIALVTQGLYCLKTVKYLPMVNAKRFLQMASSLLYLK